MAVTGQILNAYLMKISWHHHFHLHHHHCHRVIEKLDHPKNPGIETGGIDSTLLMVILPKLQRRRQRPGLEAQ